MARILITGMSGTGKSSLLAELSARGFITVDTDYGDYVLPDGLWDDAKMRQLIDVHPDLIVSGTVENQVDFYDDFDHVELLSAPIDVLLDRVSRRTNSSYGHSPEQQAEIRRYVAEVEPLLRNGADVELDARRSPADLADAVQQLKHG